MAQAKIATGPLLGLGLGFISGPVMEDEVDRDSWPKKFTDSRPSDNCGWAADCKQRISAANPCF